MNMMESGEPAYTRPLGSSEQSWVRAVPGGTGITVVTILLSGPPANSLLQASLAKLQTIHPILTSSISPTAISLRSSDEPPSFQIETIPLSSLSSPLSSPSSDEIPPLQLVLEHELNRNSWAAESEWKPTFFASLYEAPETKWVLALRLHTAVCDRTAAVAMLRELPVLMRGGETAPEWGEGEAALPGPMESMIPRGRGDKPFWARGMDLVGYSLNSLRLSNLDFSDVSLTRSSQVVRLRLSKDETSRILERCKERGLKLCSVLTAAGLMAANSSKGLGDGQYENYSVVTLIDCRKSLDPVLHDHHLGFYHAGILNTHWIGGEEESVWDVAVRCYTALSNAMGCDKHFKDLGELNFLMCKAIDNPGLTPSSSLRTSFMSVFEEPIVEVAAPESQRDVGVEAYMGCASTHGVGPSIALFDTILDGELDCACVYPSPLHTREQMQGLIDEMKRVIQAGASD